jgi:hypothetical protein
MNGSATRVPKAPRRNVRRGKCFFVTIIRGSWADLNVGPLPFN